MSVRLLAFAGARDAIGAAELALSLTEPTTARSLLARLCREHPALAPYESSIRLAVNGTYAAWEDPIHDGDEVALIPPVAGG